MISLISISTMEEETTPHLHLYKLGALIRALHWYPDQGSQGSALIRAQALFKESVMHDFPHLYLNHGRETLLAQGLEQS